MLATTASALDIITSALRKLKVLGADQGAPEADDAAVGLNELNEIIGQRNARKRASKFIRTQSWPFAVARASYTVGAAAASPNFSVTAGGPPVMLSGAKIINTDGSTPFEMDCYVWTWEQYQAAINLPTLASNFPIGIYYQYGIPLATIFPWPAYPAFTAYKMQLSWPDEFLEIAATDIDTAISLKPGEKRDLSLTLAKALYLLFPKKTDLAELKEQQMEAAKDFRAFNTAPPNIATDDGMNPGHGGGWNWLTNRPG